MLDGEKIVIFGAGKQLKECLPLLKRIEHLNVIAILDNCPDQAVVRQLRGRAYDVCTPTRLKEMAFDRIVIFSAFSQDIFLQLTLGYGVPVDKVEKEGRKWLAKLRLLERYRGTHDERLRKNLELLEATDLDTHGIFGAGYIKDYSFDEIHWDTEHNYPYIIVDGKRLYYPNKWGYEVRNGKQGKENLYGEQQPGSPHLYTYPGHEPQAGDVIMDAGVYEGNFALKYIERVSKCYLVECDPMWKEPLQLTFAPWKDKVVFCNKFLSDRCNNRETTIDDIVSTDGHLDFLKMDIEGAEERALRGGRKTLRGNDVTCSICTYHTKEAAHNIEQIMTAMGYSGHFSDGYMLFWYDPEWWNDPDYRKGIFYGRAAGTNGETFA